MRIAVMGTGGVGGFFGAKLALAGNDVSFIARGRHLDAMRAGGLRIGAATLLVDIVESPDVQKHTPLLAMAAGKIGTPQVRNMATIGGNLCQRPRCWYFRNNYPCYKHGGNACFSVIGENDFNAILDAGPSYIVHPSDAAPALDKEIDDNPRLSAYEEERCEDVPSIVIPKSRRFEQDVAVLRQPILADAPSL